MKRRRRKKKLSHLELLRGVAPGAEAQALPLLPLLLLLFGLLLQVLAVLLLQSRVDLRRVVAVSDVSVSFPSTSSSAASFFVVVLFIIIIVVVVPAAVAPCPRRVVVAVDRLGQEQAQLGRHRSRHVAFLPQRRGDRVGRRRAAKDGERRADHLPNLMEDERLPEDDEPDPALAVGEHGDAVAAEGDDEAGGGRVRVRDADCEVVEAVFLKKERERGDDFVRVSESNFFRSSSPSFSLFLEKNSKNSLVRPFILGQDRV